MRIPTTWALFRMVTCILLVLSGGNIAAQSAADQSLKALPQTLKDNGENRVVNKSNTASNNAMNKMDSASNKALKGFTGLFKKKNKKKGAGDSTAVHPADSTTVPKPSSYNRPILLYDKPLQTGNAPGGECIAFYDRRKNAGLFINTIFS